MTARVLVVDDIPVNVRLLEAKLLAEYFHVLTAGSGNEALEKVRNEKPDIVLLDVMMPGMDGFEVCRRIKRDPATAHIPVVMVTALDQPADRIAGLHSGADDFLTKPVDDVSMFARVRSLVRMKGMFEELRMREEARRNLGLFDADEIGFDSNPTGAILFVDDRPDLDVWINLLRSQRHHVAGFARFDTALEYASKNPCDLVVVNVSMQAFDGLRLCAELRANSAFRNTPVVVLVGDREHRKLAQALDLGANDYLRLPLDASEFLVRVKTQLRKKRYADRLRLNLKLDMEMAVKDQLTGLFNRRYMAQYLETLLRNASAIRPISLLIMDIDYFKQVNDTYGHASGDDVLRQFSDRLSLNIRNVDLACRYGGEEFVVVLSDTDPALACTIGERLRRAVEQKNFPIGDPATEVPVTVSIGVASSTGGDDDSTKLLRRADEALYRAKREGRNRVIGQAA
jgi:two-component system, cell cycle response regulator